MASFKMLTPRQKAEERTVKARMELAKDRGEAHLEFAKRQLAAGDKFRAREAAEEGLNLTDHCPRYLAVREQLMDFLAAI